MERILHSVEVEKRVIRLTYFPLRWHAFCEDMKNGKKFIQFQTDLQQNIVVAMNSCENSSLSQFKCKNKNKRHHELNEAYMMNMRLLVHWNREKKIGVDINRRKKRITSIVIVNLCCTSDIHGCCIVKHYWNHVANLLLLLIFHVRYLFFHCLPYVYTRYI